jgi:alpha-beta hydrolase superfamily lysophospholipase
MNCEKFSFTSSDGLDITCYRWTHSGPSAGIVQIAHGMGDHALRYDYTATFLSAAGFEVYANDHRGHGRTATSPQSFGDFGPGGWDALVADVVTLTRIARSSQPGIPVILVGHSMGSFAVQQYLLDHSQLVAGAVLAGSAALDKLKIDPSKAADLTAFNREFEPARTPYDWLSRDPAAVDAYVADPLCGFALKPLALKSFADAASRLADPIEIARIRLNLPIYILAGDRDPINHHLECLKPLAQRYRAAGLGDMIEKYYPGGRHEMLNETNRDEVLQDLLSWTKRSCPVQKQMSTLREG